MIGYLFLGVALLVALVLIGQWFVRADPKVLVKSLRWVILGIVAAVVLFLTVTGRLAWAMMLLPALLPWFLRMRMLARTARNFHRMAGAMGGFGGGGGARTGQSSEVRTRFLDMVLDHATGDLRGTVIEGPYSGRALDEMALAELVDLLNHCLLEDGQSAQVLETYLDRNHPDWRERVQAAGAGNGSDQGRGASAGGMSRDEAFQVLGLEPGADDEAIKAAHHRLIANLHPDRGGSTYLAAKINEAKDILLKRG